MALPPILSNMPLLKVFKSDKAQAENTMSSIAENNLTAANPQDVVEISATAAERLQGTKVLSLENEQELRAVLGETRHILASTGQSLGLKENFS